MTSKQDSLSANKKALLKIRELKSELAARESLQYEPIAICSMACRFPKDADTPQKFWNQLLSGDSHVSDVPESRWDPEAFFDEDPETPGKMYTQKGVYLDQIDQMDPEFFGISPREATWVDPQQRLLMEVSWEAIERAGWIPEKVGDNTGVFVGWMHNDYQNEASDSFLNLNPYIATGAAGSFLCGRLAYYLGLHGPALAVDTACSSSLVALHLAIQSLQKRECDRAIVGGVNVICSPTTNILTCKLKALSPQGHSRAFDASADGYLRGEGCGVVALRRLTDAEAAGDQVLAVIRGSSVGHNGFSSGLTAPNPKAQETVIRQALERAGLGPNDVSYLEAHGTGTELGDPLEVQAASAALCQQRSEENPLLVGSVKTNIGHLEAAAGMAGLIKVLLAMQNDQIPGQLNFEDPNPHIAWDKTPIRVLTEPHQWPEKSRRIAGVSAFGMSGTNAHVVLEAATTDAQPTQTKTGDSSVDASPALLTISARNEEALLSLIDEYQNRLESPANVNDEEEFRKICLGSQLRRSHFEHRAAVVASDRQSAIESLQNLARNRADEMTFVGQAKKRLKLAWQFTGQGSQYVGMGEELFQTEPVFREALLQCEGWMKEYRDEPLTDVLFSNPDALHDTLWTQPGIFSIQMGLAHLLDHWGFKPDLVLGHSVGQYAAACVAGIISWQDGLRLISERGRVISSLPREGRMLAVFAGADIVEELVSKYDGVDVGAYNVTHVVVTGQSSAVDEIEAELSGKGIKSKGLQTSHAFHSMLMEPVLDEFAAFAEPVEFHSSKIPLVCNQSGEILPADFKFDGRYWANHIRGAVQYQKSLQQVIDYQCDAVVELGPRPVLTGMAKAMGSAKKPSLSSCLDKNKNNRESIRQVLASLYVNGLNPEFESLNSETGSEVVDLPTYPFQRRRFWGPDKPRADHAEHHTAHPLLGSSLSLANSNSETRFESHVDTDSPSWMPDHQVMGASVMPGAAFVELAVEAARKFGDEIELRELKFESPLRIASRTALQTILNSPQEADKSAEPNGSAAEKIFLESYSQANAQSPWTRNFTVGSCHISASELPEQVDVEALRQNCSDNIDVDEFYSFLESIDLTYGERFRTIDSLSTSNDGVLSHLVERADLKGYNVSPTLLDGAFHSLAVAISRDGDEMFLPVALGSVKVYGELSDDFWCHAKWVTNEGNLRVADLVLFSPEGEVLVEIKGLSVQRIDRSTIRKANRSGPQQLLHEFKWRKSRLAGATLENRKWWIVSSTEAASANARQLSAELLSRGHHCRSIQFEDGHATVGDYDEAGKFCEATSAALKEDGEFDWSVCKAEFAAQSESGSDGLPNGIIWLLEHDMQAGPRDGVTERNAKGLISLIQWLRKSSVRALDAGIQLVTSDAIATHSESDETANPKIDPQQSQYWGLGRVLSAECPEYRCRMIDINSAISTENRVKALADTLLIDNEENQIAIREKDFLVPRITKQTVAPQKSGTEKKQEWLRADSSFLVTGGLGKLGRQAAYWLAENDAAQVVLVSRREPDDETVEFIKEVESMGTIVVVHNADVSDAGDVEKLFSRFGQDLKPLGGIIHAAGVLDDGLVNNQNWDRFEKVLRPKIDAAWLLHQASLNHDPGFFVLYSSVASILGSPGQSNYAMANAYLDGLAEHRVQHGLPATSLNWGPWTEGMADDDRIKRRLAAQGITALEAKDAHEAMELVLDSGDVQSFVIDVDWRKLKLGADGKTPLILSDLVVGKEKGRKDDSQLVAKLKKMPPAAQQELLITTVQKIFQDVLASDTPPEIDRPLIEMGLDSLMAVEFGTGLQQAFGSQYEIGPSLLFDHPTIEAIAGYLGTLILEGKDETGSKDSAAQAKEEQTPASVSVQPEMRDDIAIIGVGCRFPGAQNADEYWQNLLAGVDSVGEIPADRWDVERFFSDQREPGKMYTREGGFLDDIGDFDASFFNISAAEACWIDPQHRMLLENSYHALEHAGINPKVLKNTSVGVFMGIMGQDYAFLPTLDDREVIEGFEGAGLSHSAGVGRISHLLGLEGPSVAVDTASSSSLVAVIQAMRSLQEGNCNLALAGGANAILAPVNSLLMSKVGLLSPDGRCKSFSEAADGFGRGEGCGVVVLKRLSEAQKDGDRILAVIRGGAIGHNGFTGGLTTPSTKAQVRVLESAVRDAGISPAQIQYLEAHGTGTEFGDPIELAAATQVYGKGRKKDEPLVVGSAKANIGHLEAAGGVSGLIKAVLSLHHNEIPRQIHFESPSKHIPWARMPIVVSGHQSPSKNSSNESNGKASKDHPAKLEFAAVTALGLAGTNAHVILSAEPNFESDNSKSGSAESEKNDARETSSQVSANTSQCPLFVSAKSEYSLTRLLNSYQSLLSKLSKESDPATRTKAWAKLCYKSANERQHFDTRACIIAESVEQASAEIESLIQLRADKGHLKESTNGSTRSSRKSIDHIVWFFSGQDQFAVEAIDELCEHSPTVASMFDRFEKRIADRLPAETSFSQHLRNKETSSEWLVDFVVYAGLARHWQSLGMEPTLVSGLGVGQLVAACVADVLSFEDALELVFYLQACRNEEGQGKINWDEFEQLADQFNYYPPNLNLYCPLDKKEIPVHQTPGGSYWRRFADEAIWNDLSDVDFGQLPCDLLMNMGRAGTHDFTEDSSIKKQMDGYDPEKGIAKCQVDLLAKLYLAGFTPDFSAMKNPDSAKKLELPVYPFEKKRFWITEISDHLKSKQTHEERSGTHV